MYQTVRHWADVISNTGLSMWFQNQLWVIPTSQSIHICCVSIVFGSAAMISLRLLGIGNSGRKVSELVATLVPWMYRGLVVLLITGSVQTIAEPLRQFVTPNFWWKMSMIVVVLAITIWLQRAVRANPEKWDSRALRPATGYLIALITLGLWIGIVACGRFIGYTWLFHV